MATYFFFEGSALTAQIRALWRKDKSFRGKKLCTKRLVQYYMDNLPDLHGGGYKRATFYFPIGDEVSIEDFLSVPDFKRPGEVKDFHFKFCGQKLKKSAKFADFIEKQVPPEFQDRFSKSEKGIDIEICCDALKLASAAKLERLFLFTNDDDFIPLCRALKEFGTNVSILHLSEYVNQNVSLLKEADTFDRVELSRLGEVFLQADFSEDITMLAEDVVDPSAEKPSAVCADISLEDDNEAESTDIP